jgi:two-component system sensor histidine kinase QseC
VNIRSRFSLNRRLLVGLIAVTFTYWIVIACLTIRDSVDQVYELFDVHLAQTALALLRISDPDDTETATIPMRTEAPSLLAVFDQWPDLALGTSRGKAGRSESGSMHSLHAEYEKSIRYQVWTAEGSLIASSANAPMEAATSIDGYSQTTDSEGHVWRNFGIWDQHQSFRVLVSEDYAMRGRLVRNITAHVASPLALGMPALILLLWITVGKALNPLGVLTRQIEARKADNLTPLNAHNTPREVQTMVQALNSLLVRMASTLEAERRFTANAAHELRTPLAAIQAQLYVARTAQTDVERQFAMDQLQSGVGRGIRLVEQLLNLARLDPDQSLPDPLAVDLGAMAQTVCAELAPLALQKDQHLELHVDSPLPPVAGNMDMLAMLLSNLVDNAIHYTQRGGSITIAVRHTDQCMLMEVCDNGPGIPVEQREHMFARFSRLSGQDQPGTGLGLAIAQCIAQLHHAQITLNDGPDQRGITARVCIPVSLHFGTE